MLYTYIYIYLYLYMIYIYMHIYIYIYIIYIYIYIYIAPFQRNSLDYIRASANYSCQIRVRPRCNDLTCTCPIMSHIHYIISI